jgi:flagellar hook-length control protein FliK
MDMAEAVAPLVVPVAMPVSKDTGRPSESGAPETPTLNTRPPGKKMQPTLEPASEPRFPANAGSVTAVFAALTSTAEVSSDSGATTETLAPAISVSLAGGAPTPSSQATIQASVPSTFVPTHTALVAAPTDLVGIISKTAEDGQSDRVVVQLDPPELGRVSIDFKFDSQGIQHVTITSETPEAMRQLRQMHGELVQALERQGIGSQNMSFQHQQQNSHAQPERGSFHMPSARAQTGQDGGAEILTTTHNLERPRISAGGRLDIKA